MRGIGRKDEDSGTWISDEILESYQELHRLGIAHSVEAWQDDRLAGGLYGVALGGAFFGESMFHRATDASKVALAALVERLRARGFSLLDVQWVTPHLEQFGAIEIPRSSYLKRLERALAIDCGLPGAAPASRVGGAASLVHRVGLAKGKRRDFRVETVPVLRDHLVSAFHYAKRGGERTT